MDDSSKSSGPEEAGASRSMPRIECVLKASKPPFDATLQIDLSNSFDSRKFFLAIPHDLLAAWLNTVEDCLDPAAHELEIAVTQLAEQFAAAGYWQGRVVYWDLISGKQFKFVTPSGPRKDEQRKEDVHLEQLLREANKRVAPLQRIAEGYAGWLLTNPEFHAEHDALLVRWQTQIQQHGLQFVGRTISTAPINSVQWGAAVTDRDYAAFDSAVRSFLVKWRLQQLVAPGLPYPMTPVMGGQFPVSILQQQMDSGGLFYLPDTFPIPSRDELRVMLVDALRSSDADHLSEWRKIVAANNPSKTRIGKFARLLRIVLYWRAFFQRHGTELRGSTGKLQACLREYLQVDLSTIRGDFKFIEKRLGKEWGASPLPLIFSAPDRDDSSASGKC